MKKEKIPKESLITIVVIFICFIITWYIALFSGTYNLKANTATDPLTDTTTFDEILENNAKYEPYLPENALHPVSNTNIGYYYDGPSGIESYYTASEVWTIESMRKMGYSEEEYPYWIREDGVQMLGQYCIVATNIDDYPYGSLIETSLGTGIVCDTGSSFYSGDRYLDIGTVWY